MKDVLGVVRSETRTGDGAGFDWPSPRPSAMISRPLACAARQLPCPALHTAEDTREPASPAAPRTSHPSPPQPAAATGALPDVTATATAEGWHGHADAIQDRD